MVPASRWWSRARGMPAWAYTSWVESLKTPPGRQARVLAWATTPDGMCVGSPAALSYSDGDPSVPSWVHVGWHEIEHGGWNSETRSLSWRLHSGARGSVELATAGRLPELFRERIAASIVFERFVPLPDGPTAGTSARGVTVSGRRELSDRPGPIAWHATLTRGVTWSTPGVREQADAAIEALRLEYDSA